MFCEKTILPQNVCEVEVGTPVPTKIKDVSLAYCCGKNGLPQYYCVVWKSVKPTRENKVIKPHELPCW